MAGHPSVKKRQKEVARKERQAEKLSRRDERREKRNDPTAPDPEVGSEEWLAAGLAQLERANADAPAVRAEPPARDAPAPAPPGKPGPVAAGKP